MTKDGPIRASSFDILSSFGFRHSSFEVSTMAMIDDTYAEAFRSIYAEVLITARDRVWLDHAVNAATGNASSSILCDCEAGLDRYVGAETTPDGRPGAIVQFHVP